MNENAGTTINNLNYMRHSQAYPAALDANPAAVGKLFSEQTWILYSKIDLFDFSCCFPLNFTRKKYQSNSWNIITFKKSY